MRRIEMAILLQRSLLFLLTGFLSACASLSPPTPIANAPVAASAAQKPAVSAGPEISASSRQTYDRALASLKVGKFADAERELRALTVKEPHLSGPYANLGIVYRRTGKAAEAIKALERAIDLNPKPAYYNELGMVQRAEGRFDHARRSYQKAIDLDPGYAYAHLNLGILYDLYLQEPDKALAHYERYQALAPNDAGTVGKWIADLKRRSNRTAEQGKGGKSG